MQKRRIERPAEMEPILFTSRRGYFFLLHSRRGRFARRNGKNESREATRTLSLGDLSKFRSSIRMLSRPEHDFAGKPIITAGPGKKGKIGRR